MTETKPRTAIVTGASKGIGAAIATRLAADGLNVVVNYASDRTGAEEIADAIAVANGHAIVAQADVGAPEGVPTLFEAAEAAFGSVDVLINNAGMMKLAPLADVDDDTFDQHLAVNIGGVFRGLREASRRLADGGRIVSFSSSVVGAYPPTYGVYAATKAAVEAMTHVLSKEVAKRGITVNAIAPGPVETKLFMQDKTEEEIATATGRIPFGRLGQPDEIAGAVSWLVGADGGWVNGQVIRVNGGMI
ncbi:SDR family oxidoreductase [Amorphus sp. 3PC139-8]|uniref:SDR family oxidoreductase n=1 Tax=Amorphus sp. 3PC139-8 TaxID=2735676 RepID=UPI00345CD9E0